MRRLWCVLILLLTGAHLFGQTFHNPRRLVTQGLPDTVLVGDLNGDGRPDIIYSTLVFSGGGSELVVITTSLHVLLADAQGNYLPGQAIALPTTLSPGCALGDMNGDKVSDLVCTGFGTSASVGVLLGNGDGSFGAPQIAVHPGLEDGKPEYSQITIADINGDGAPDVLIPAGLSMFPLLGDGKGGLTPAAPIPANIYAIRALALDLNGDGKQDLVVQAGSENTAVLLGRGDGSFAAPVQYTGNTDVVLADVDGDGHVDMVGGDAGMLRIFHGNSDGSFDPKPIVSVNYGDGQADSASLNLYAIPFAVVDVDGDGQKDILASSADGLVVLRGRPNLMFGTPVPYALPTGYKSLGPHLRSQVADMNGDGHPDVVSVGPGELLLSYGQADASFTSAAVYQSGTDLNAETLADFNEDGNPDVVTTGNAMLQLSAGLPDGTFKAAVPIAPSFSMAAGLQGSLSIAHGDLNGDEHQDLVVFDGPGTSGFSVLLGGGDGTFRVASHTTTPYTTYSLQAVTDLNRDGRDDVVVYPALGQMEVYLSQADGSFQHLTTTLTAPSGEYIRASVVQDVDGDGKPDLIYATDAHVAVMRGAGDGTFLPPVFIPVPVSRQSGPGVATIAVGDFDGDGARDIAALVDVGASVQLFTLYHQGPAGAFSDQSFAVVPGPTSLLGLGSVTAADLNGDGTADVIATGSGTATGEGGIAIFAGQKDRTFAQEADFYGGGGDAPPEVADLNHDGLPDLLKENYVGASNSFTVLLAEGPELPTGTLTGMPNPVVAGAPFTLQAVVKLPGQTASFQGTVSFAVDGTGVGSAALASNAALLAGPTSLSVGTHTLTAVVSGLSANGTSYQNLQLTGTETVTALPVQVTVSAAPQTAVAGQNVQLQATVGNSAGAPVGSAAPGGAVSITVDGLLVGSGGTVSNGLLVLSLPYNTTSVGTHAVVASYGGDATHGAGSATVQLTITAPPVQGSFQIGLSPAAVNLATGESVSTTVQVTGVNGYTGLLALSVGSLPAGVKAVFQPGLLTVPAGGQASAALTLSAGQSGTGVMYPRVRLAGVTGAAMLLALLGLGGRRRRSLLRGLACLGLLVTCVTAFSGCGLVRLPLGSTGTATTYQVPVTGTDMTTGQTQTTTLTVVLMQ